MPTGDTYSSGHVVLSFLGFAFVLLVETSDTIYRLDILSFCDIITGLNITESDISRNIGFHRAYATGVACRQGTLTPPDIWSRPFGTCICSTCWDQSFFELVVILPDYALRISLGTFSILLWSNRKNDTEVIWLRYTTKHFSRYIMCYALCGFEIQGSNYYFIELEKAMQMKSTMTIS